MHTELLAQLHEEMALRCEHGVHGTQQWSAVVREASLYSIQWLGLSIHYKTSVRTGGLALHTAVHVHVVPVNV
jgi:hypothetical protein